MIIKRLALAAAIGAVALGANPGFAAADGANQEFTIVKLGANTGTVVGSGLITGAGTEENTKHDVGPGQPFKVTFTFPQGMLFIDNVPGPPQIDFNPTSCLTRITIHPVTTVTGGTGAFAGASGAGTATTDITTIANRGADGNCLPPSSPPLFELAIARSAMTLVLP